MKNKKIILLAGFTRGGTNILWNIMQSHPQVTSSRYETGEIFGEKNSAGIATIFKFFNKTGLINFKSAQKVIDNKLYQLKISNLSDEYDKYSFENQIYTLSEIANTALCFKSVDYDIDYTSSLLKIYPNLYFIALTRNGYALANGHIRRGGSEADIANLYKSTAKELESIKNTVKNFKLIKFEDVLNDPFNTAEELYRFINVEPHRVEKLKLKSKKITSPQGDHKSAYGETGKKYWFDRNSIFNLLDPSINSTQIQQLSQKSIKIVNEEAGDALNYFGYKKIIY